MLFVINGCVRVGVFILGAGLYSVAPEYIKKVLMKGKKEEDEDSKNI